MARLLNATRSTRRLAAGFLTAFLSLPGVSLAAQTGVLHEYRLTAWGSTEGWTSGTLWAIAQDAAGYLWLGTDVGLVRFDGVRFSRWTSFGTTQLPRASIRALCIAHDGTMWVGFGSLQGVSRLQAGQVRNFTVGDGMPSMDVTAIVEDSAGTIWAGGSAGLFRFANGRWMHRGAGDGLPPGPVYSASVDRSGGVIVGMSSGVFRKLAGREAFESVGILDGQVSLADFSRLFGGDVVRAVLEDPAGHVWVTDPIVGFRGVESWQRSTETGRGAALLADKRGNLWVGTWAQGLWRVTRGAPDNARPIVDRATSLGDIAGNQVRSLLEDREGNIWAGTLDGLYRLSPNKVESITDLGLIGGIGGTPNGSVWLGSGDDLVEVTRGRIRKHDELRKLTRALYRTLDIEESGTIWTSTRSELFRLAGGRVEALPLVGVDRLQSINTIAADRQGGVWLNDLEYGLLRWRNGRVEEVALPENLAHVRIESLYVDRSTQTWIAFSDGQLATIDRDDRLEVRDTKGGAGVYRPIFQDSQGLVWLGGTQGLTRFDGRDFATWRGTEALPAVPIANIVEDRSGVLWLGTASGVMRISRDDFDMAVANPSTTLRHGFYDSSDGIAGTPRWFGKQSSVRGPDGRLWFLTSRGVSILDPRSLPERVPSAPVQIELVLANGQSREAVSGIELPSHTERLEFEYSVPTLTSSAKTQFRYRLEGFDAEWVLAGTRRQAFYTGVPPGRYRFQVMAGNSQGDWVAPPAELVLSVEPAFYRAWWFLPACVLAMIALVASAWRLHLLRVRREFSFVLAERLRLSREIHDTLLQSLLGVALQCDALADDIEQESPAKTQFRRLRREVEEHIRDARQVIWNLRSPMLDHDDLASALLRAGRQAVNGTHVAFNLRIDGKPKPCSELVQGQLLRIGQEAIINAVRHAHATKIEVVIEHTPESIRLRVSDDGRGFTFDEVSLEADRHYGLLSMRERAESAGGQLRVISRAGLGTTIEAVLENGAAELEAYANA